MDDISVASGLTSEASTVQEQDLSGFEAVSQSRRWTPAQSEQQARAAGDPARSVQVEEDRQREQLFGKTKQPPAAAAAPQSPGQVSAGRAAPPSAPTPNKSVSCRLCSLAAACHMHCTHSRKLPWHCSPTGACWHQVAKPPAKQQAPEPIVSKMSEKLPEAVNATEDPQWSMTAVDAALNLDREEEIIALREVARQLAAIASSMSACSSSTHTYPSGFPTCILESGHVSRLSRRHGQSRRQHFVCGSCATLDIVLLLTSWLPLVRHTAMRWLLCTGVQDSRDTHGGAAGQLQGQVSCAPAAGRSAEV